MTDDVLACGACGAALPTGARFCPGCGARVGAGADVAYTSTPPRLFGVASPDSLLVAAGVLLLGALAAALAGSWPLAVLLAALAAALLVLFAGAIERDTTSRGARAARAVGNGARTWIRFVVESASVWARAVRGLVRLSPELRRLRRERTEVQLALGDAAYREDADDVGSLRARLGEIDAAIAGRERARADLLERARTRVADERLAVRHTKRLPPSDGGPSPGG